MKALLNRRMFNVLLIVLMILPALLGVSKYYLTLLVMICIYIISALSLNLLLGFGGQVSIGQAGFLMIGGYVAAIGSNYGIPFFIAILLSGMVAMLISLAIGLPSVRLRGHFLAVITLGFGLSIPQIALNWDSVTNGYSGMFVSKPTFLTDQLFYIGIILVTVFIIWVVRNLIDSSFGRAFVSIRESEVAAQSVGVDIAMYKLLLFGISALFTGIAGGLYAYWIGFVSPYDFSMTTSFLLLAMIVVGGVASIKGSIIGAALLSLIPHFADNFVGLTNLIIGVTMIIIILLKPSGLASISLLSKQRKKKEVEIENAEAS